jgi:CRISP-associated protein Cas1
MTELLNTLYVQTPGTSLHLDGDTVRIVHLDQPGRKILPLARIDHVVLFGGVTMTSDLLLRCADDGRTVSWLTAFGRFRARLCGPTAGNPLLRRAQYRAHDDPVPRMAIAQRMIAGKIHNSRQVLLPPPVTPHAPGKRHCERLPSGMRGSSQRRARCGTSTS